MAGLGFFLQALGVNPTVLVVGAAAFKAHCVQHAIAVKPVVTSRRLEAAVGAVAHMHAMQIARNLALHLRQFDRDLFFHRGKAPLQGDDVVKSHTKLQFLRAIYTFWNQA